MRVIGTQNRSEFELDPQQAYRRGRALDAMLRAARPPNERGLFRGSPADLQKLDEMRAQAAARRINRQ